MSTLVLASSWRRLGGATHMFPGYAANDGQIYKCQKNQPIAAPPRNKRSQERTKMQLAESQAERWQQVARRQWRPVIHEEICSDPFAHLPKAQTA